MEPKSKLTWCGTSGVCHSDLYSTKNLLFSSVHAVIWHLASLESTSVFKPRSYFTWAAQVKTRFGGGNMVWPLVFNSGLLQWIILALELLTGLSCTLSDLHYSLSFSLHSHLHPLPLPFTSFWSPLSAGALIWSVLLSAPFSFASVTFNFFLLFAF